ncbi:TonB-dependent receptor [Gloeocapsopsis crepidinum LEGE 06123]|uniref:TonB-dependent receptor n=1 Tax=Gloeocapsopsis crepidinum LEGE 06123 TaxID=588587 RepID=A0ABR9UZ08_9CHRO|nr:TonB-dependent receptor [Gloeocapsopsis crepidinum]MBE9193537.1 TonB-dependent receptor [Gloeocapsopsis crepidinum LEGE 06123]
MKLKNLLQLLLLTSSVWLWGAVSVTAQEATKLETHDKTITSVLRKSRLIREIPQIGERERPSTSAVMLVQSPAPTNPSSVQRGVIQVTGVQANPTAQGVEVILQTTQGEQLQITNRSAGNNFIADIPNAQLRLPNGDAFTFNSQKPIKGITEITVTNLDANTIRVTVAGEEGLPTVALFDSNEGLIFGLTPAVTAMQPPQQPEVEQPTGETPQEIPSVSPGVATDATAEDDAIQVVVTATRTEEEITRVPRSVTVIDREDLDTQTTLSPSLPELLTREVPGFGIASPQANERGVLRGRGISYLIDGIPVSDNFARPQRTISLDAIGRVEVVRGPNAVFGAQATGGTVNLIPRRPEEGESNVFAEIGTTAAAGGGDSFFIGEGFGYFSRFGFSGNVNPVDYLFSFSYEREGSFFDAEGDRIFFARPSDENRTLNALGQLGFDLNEEQRLQLTFNHYDIERVNNEFIADIEGSEEAGKARGIRVGQQEFIDTPPFFDRNTIVSLRYNHDNLFGSSLSAQGYYRNYSGITAGINDFREFFGFISNALLLDIEGGGARLQIQTPLGQQANLLWGADYDYQRRDGFADFIDPVAFDESNGRVIQRIERRRVLPYSVGDLGLFAQMQWEVVDDLTLSGGLRYSNFDVNVSSYTSYFRGFDIEGGRFSFDDVVFNAGVVYQVTDEIGLFANFAQGFSLPNLNVIVNNPPENLNIEANTDLLQPVNVNNYELGIRGNWGSVQFSLAGFFSNSSLSDAVQQVETDEGFPIFEVVRAPQREYGVEAALDWQPSDNWLLGTTLSWQEGDIDFDDTGDFLPQSTYAISPLKWTAYVENQTLPGWRNRLQLLAVGGRSRNFEGGGFDPRATDGYVVVDYISSINIGSGTLNIGIQNLFNNQYLVPSEQLNAAFEGFASTATASRGRTISATYRITF